MSSVLRPRGGWLVAALVILAVAGCTMPSVLPPSPVPPATGETVTLYVGPVQVDCVGVGPQKCLLVKASPDAPYQFFYSSIEGFTFEESYNYELSVLKTPVANAPADASTFQYQLVEVVSKTPAGEISTLYVAPMTTECETTQIYECLLVADSPEGEYRPFYGKIQGFEYEPGYRYALLVEKVAMEQPPADAPAGVWNLLAVTEKVAAPPAVSAALPLEGALWVLDAYVNAQGETVPALEGAEVTASFQDGRIAGNASCNNYTADYQLDGSQLTIGPAITTRMACITPELSEQEAAYLAALATIASYKIDGETLTLANAEGQVVLTYAASMPIPLIGTTWTVTNYNNGKQAVVSLLADTELTLLFGEDGNVSGSAGCNNYAGAYAVDGSAIKIGPLASTMMMCAAPEGVMEQEMLYLAALQGATTFAIQGDKLELRNDTGALMVWAVAQEAAAPAAVETTPLEGTLWTLATYANAQGELTAPLEGSKVTATFQEGRVSGNASCNTYGAGYTVDGAKLTIGMAMTTMMACEPQEVMQQEQAYLAALAQTAAYQIEGETLTLTDAEGKVLLTYAATRPLTLTGVNWTVTNYNNGKGGVVSLLADAELTLAFSEDGNVSGSAGCNNYAGGYTVDGSAIKIGPLASTMMMCAAPEGVMEQEAQYLAALQAATTFAISADIIELRDDGGALQIRAVAQAAPTEAGTPLEGTLWVLTAYMDTAGAAMEPIDGAEATASFQDGKVGGNASCNNYAADYQVDGSSMTIGVAVTTMMMCQPEAVAQQEQSYLAALSKVAAYQIEGETLTLSDAEGNALLTYVASKPAPLTGTDWQVGFYNNGKEALVSPIAGTQATVLFGEDGQVSGTTGCNNYSGPFTVDGDAIQIGLLATTRMMCAGPEGIMEQESAFLAALQSAATFSIQGDELDLLNADGVRAVTAFAQAPVAAAGGNPADVIGVNWVWQGTLYNNDTELQSDDPGAYTLELTTDGQALVRADCNSLAGKYTLSEDGVVTIELPTDAISDCGEASPADEFLRDLNSAAIFFLADGALFIDLFADAGTMQFAQAGAVPVAPSGEATAAPAPAASTVVGPVWAWQSLNLSDGSVTAVPDPSQYTVEFLEDGTLQVQADCNKGGGAYTTENGILTIEVAALTRMACPPDSLSDEFVARLNAASSYAIDQGELYLNLDDGVVVFKALAGEEQKAPEAAPAATPTPAPVEPSAAAPAPGNAARIVGPTWQWVGSQDPTERFSVETPERYTIKFRADGKYELRADCNTGSGGYTLDGAKLMVGPTALTRKACLADSRADAFVKSLNAATTQFVAGTNLYIVTSDGGVMKLQGVR